MCASGLMYASRHRAMAWDFCGEIKKSHFVETSRCASLAGPFQLGFKKAVFFLYVNSVTCCDGQIIGIISQPKKIVTSEMQQRIRGSRRSLNPTGMSEPGGKRHWNMPWKKGSILARVHIADGLAERQPGTGNRLPSNTYTAFKSVWNLIKEWLGQQ